MPPALIWLGEAEHEAHFGGKAVSLGAAIRAGLPVPGGLAIAAPHVNRIASGDAAALDACVQVQSGSTHRLGSTSGQRPSSDHLRRLEHHLAQR